MSARSRGPQAGSFVASDFGGGRESVHFRHVAVHEDGIVGETRGQFDRLAAVGGQVHSALQLFQQPHGQALIGGIVLGQQHATTRRPQSKKV